MLKRLLLAVMAALVALALAFMFGASFGVPRMVLASDSGPPGIVLTVTLAPDVGQEALPVNAIYLDYAVAAVGKRGQGQEPATVLLV